MNPRMRGRAVRAIGAALLLVLVFGVWRGGQALAIGVAYKSKMLCSGTFVSQRDPAAVLGDLHIDDLSILRFIDASVDASARSVTASAFGFVTRRAVYREGLGCALVLDGRTPPPQHADDTFVVVPQIGAPRGAAVTELVSAEGSSDGALKAVIDRAFAEPDSERPRRTQAVVVVHRGQVVGERYGAGIRPDTPLIGWSMTKSVMNALVGVLVRQGRLTLESPAPIPEWHRADDPRGAITVDDLLRMSSGLRFDEDMANPRADVMRMLLEVGDAAEFATKQALVATPGTRWQYSSGTSNIIARVIRNTLRDDSKYLTFPRHALFDRLGMTRAVLETDAAGTFVGSSYMYATARDWARFGMLYLQEGVWGGERILPEGWVAHARSPAPADPTKRYGAHFWLAVPDEYCGTDMPLPRDAFHAAGHEGQLVTIVPSRDAVIVRLGLTRYRKAWDHCAFVRDVLAALDLPRGGRP
jgi:hypothetical protein